MKRLLINCTLAGAIAYAIVACGGDGPSTTNDPTSQRISWGKNVQEITLSDGTTCVVATSSEGGIAITCNWRNG